MVDKFTHFCCENALRLLCVRKHEKKNKLRKSGYIVDKPNDYHPELYSKTSRSCWDVTVYSKYGKGYTPEQIYKLYNIKFNNKSNYKSNYKSNNKSNYNSNKSNNKRRKRRNNKN